MASELLGHANRFGKGSIEVTPAQPGEGPVRRLAICADKLVTQPKEGINTVRDVVEYAANVHGDKNLVGWRDVVRMHEESKEVKKTVNGKEITEVKKWSYFELTDYQYLTGKEFAEAITETARALMDLGFTKDDVVNVFASTSVNWQLIALGCAFTGIPIATAYDTLGPEGLTHSLNEPDCVAVFTNADLLKTVIAVLPKTPTIKYVLYDGKPSEDQLAKLRSIRPDSLKILSIDELRERGRALPKATIDGRRPTSDQLACIMYTSGSTGNPKGVCITHGNLIASIAGLNTLLGPHLTPGNKYLAYLPLAHVFEYIVELGLIYHGFLVGYGRNRTLADSSVRNCLGDMSALQPTFLLGVPAVWETIRKGIESKVEKSGAVAKGVFGSAMGVKKLGIPGLTWLAETLVLSKVKQATGGHVVFTINGGAPIGQQTKDFIALGVAPMIQGYGMTETCGMCAVLPPEAFGGDPNAAGLPVPSIEIKFRDAPDVGYLSSHDPPTGEILIRGPSVTKGYFKRPDLNEDEGVFTKDGWLRTGDVGRWNSDGTLSIIDRIKNLIKLQSGEYIALEKLESVYKSSPFVGNICVYATQHAKQPIAILFPQEPKLRASLAAGAGGEDFAHLPFDELCKHPAARKAVLQSCLEVGRAHGLKGPELLENVVVVPDEWTLESGLVTAAMKIQRSKIVKRWEAEIKEAYGEK